MHTSNIQVNNEIGFLKKVLMHYPGKEIAMVSTKKIKRMDLRDIVFLDQIQQEHNYFAQQLRNAGVEVFYLEKILAQVLDANPEIRLAFIYYFLEQANLENTDIRNACFQYLNKIHNNYQLVLATISGIKKDDVNVYLTDNFDQTT